MPARVESIRVTGNTEIETLRFPVVGERNWASYDVFRVKICFLVRPGFGDSMQHSGKFISTLVTMLAVAGCVHALGQAASPAIPAHKSAIVLFDGSDLKNFDTFLTSSG
jgi:hypothetical protein